MIFSLLYASHPRQQFITHELWQGITSHFVCTKSTDGNEIGAQFIQIDDGM